MKFIVILVIITACLVPIGCVRKFIPPKQTVLSQSEYILNFDDGATRISIIHTGITERKVTINGNSSQLNIIVRDQEFGYPGQIGRPIWGIYDPGEGNFKSSDLRIVYQENEVHLSNTEELKRWMIQSSAILQRTYLGEGKVISWSHKGSHYSINLNRIYVNGMLIDGI